MLESIYEKGDISPRICDEVLDTIINTDKITSTPQRIFAYCYLGVISYLNINNKYTDKEIKVKDIKKWLGYSEGNKKVDYIIKKNGVLEELGLITDANNPYKGNTKNHIKIPLSLDEMKDCHTFNLSLYFNCMKNSELGIIGFFIANFVKELKSDYIYGVRGSINYLSKKFHLAVATVSSYLEILAANNMISKNHVRNYDTLTEMSTYLRGKLNSWKQDSLDVHGNKCFITGKCDDLVIHHILPFNQIRNLVLNKLQLENKQFTDFTKDELQLIEDRILEFHKLSIGVPLTENIHKQFHLKYGHNTTMEDLLNFKDQYFSK